MMARNLVLPKLSGTSSHVARLREGIAANGRAVLAQYLFSAGQDVAVDAQTSITEGAVSGAGHVASLPGQPPNNDTGVLANNIEVNQADSQGNASQLVVTVSSDAPYASPLEFGTSKMAARPYMLPALRKNKQNIANKIRVGINKANKTEG